MSTEKMPPHLSKKIKVLSFFCILLVLYIHTYYNEGEKYESCMFLVSLFGQGISYIAVPLFYLISGYLFFLGTESKPINVVFGKQKKRIRTLLVPYLIANALNLLFYLMLPCVARYIPAIQPLIAHNLLESAGNGWIDKLYFSFYSGPIAFQLWFVRDLMVLVILSPLLYYILRFACRSKLGCILLLCLLSPLAYFRPTAFLWAMGWFCIGGLIVMNPYISITNCCKWKPLGLLSIVLCFCFVLVNAISCIGLIDFWVRPAWIIISGIIGIWIIYDCLFMESRQAGVKLLNLRIYGYTFFIYLIHEPFINIFKKLPLLISNTEWMIDFCYLIIPIVFAIIAMVVGAVLQKMFPKFYSTFTGGR